jgi:hypothetical protein
MNDMTQLYSLKINNKKEYLFFFFSITAIHDGIVLLGPNHLCYPIFIYIQYNTASLIDIEYEHAPFIISH